MPGAGLNSRNKKFSKKIIKKVEDSRFLIWETGYLEEMLVNAARLRCMGKVNQSSNPEEMRVVVRVTYNQVEENKLVCQFLDFLTFSKHFL